MSLINLFFEQKKYTSSDINEHMETLKKYSEECETIIEMGVRSIVSTWGFLNGLKKTKGKLLCIDVTHPSYFNANPSLEETISIAEKEGIEMKFLLADTLKIKIDNTDLLFIDTLHNYEQLIAELNLHSKNVNKYIIMHDTEHNRFKGDLGKEGLEKAINEFLQNNEKWSIKEVFTNNNGLTVLQRVQYE